ncbi:hypothetical protein [Lacinutrix jangbogonensis]|uniref:hypothetical protein n=1 Tax=Lacinutrix jangbogonensis TaxID=1469557 RepID=UPI00053E302C|nr:hypothetical protein [Lacinutrix jangbogonensis]
MKKSLILALTIITVLLFNPALYSQENLEVSETENIIEQSNNYQELEDERLKIIDEMYEMMYEISGLFTELERAENLEDVLGDYSLGTPEDSDLSAFSQKQRMQIQRLEEIKNRIILPELKTVGGQNLQDMKHIAVTEGFRRIIENKVQDILKKTDQLSSVGTKVTELNNTSYVSQNFKKQISWSFAFLVGLVIVGFFIIAYRDDEIRKTIFSGDAGLQFITIFSIIIAIILFGITEVLGGKELSALIGGISGYILGRSSIPEVKKESE